MPAVEVETNAPVCRIRLNRPDKLNALNNDVRRGLTDAFTSLADDVDVRVVVLEGAGRAFSAGADLSAGGFGAGEPPSWVERRHGSGAWQRLLDLMESVPQVTVARLHGHCVGGAALLAVACDLRVAADDLVVHIPELAIGIPLTWGGIPRLVREIGLPMARDLVMTARRMNADEALRCGFVQRVVPAGQLDDATDELVTQLVEMPAAPLAITRSMFAAMGRERAGASGWADADLLGWSLREPEGREAAADYVTKRLKPEK
ncbi:MAG TPA: enoyl-CoA hydratase/isomerase family protein [Actinomycetota bacterium]|jgi:enoyl-CoA hydratase/carnithine racemase|nr:enoyl-CoA hydratase/isomerase family protein [Actinomycetota bacterium]